MAESQSVPHEPMVLAIEKFNERFSPAAQQAWTYDNRHTDDYALLRDLIAALQQAQATIERLAQELEDAKALYEANHG